MFSKHTDLSTQIFIQTLKNAPINSSPELSVHDKINKTEIIFFKLLEP